jgi:CHASE2 domain-containing sensor protein
LLDAWQGIRAISRPSPQVAIVAIDTKSLELFGPMAWPRNEYVPLIERLSPYATPPTPVRSGTAAYPLQNI